MILFCQQCSWQYLYLRRFLIIIVNYMLWLLLHYPVVSLLVILTSHFFFLVRSARWTTFSPSAMWTKIFTERPYFPTANIINWRRNLNVQPSKSSWRLLYLNSPVGEFPNLRWTDFLNRGDHLIHRFESIRWLCYLLQWEILVFMK